MKKLIDGKKKKKMENDAVRNGSLLQVIFVFFSKHTEEHIQIYTNNCLEARV